VGNLPISLLGMEANLTQGGAQEGRGEQETLTKEYDVPIIMEFTGP
jgi:hypothetical protein